MSAAPAFVRRRWWLALGVLPATLLGLVASGYAGVGPIDAGVHHAAVASVQIQVDSPDAELVDLRVSELAISTQAVLIAERLTAQDARAAIARRAGVPAAELDVFSAQTAIPGRSSPLSRAAVDAARTGTGRTRLDVGATSEAPIITVLASAPDRRTALRLVAAAAPTLDALLAAGAGTSRQPVMLHPLAAPRAQDAVSGGPKPALGAVAAGSALLAWSWLVLLVSGTSRERPDVFLRAAA